MRRWRRRSTPGVPDAAYLAVLDQCDEVPISDLLEEFWGLYRVDPRVDDDERYEILQRVFFAREGLVIDGPPIDDEIGPEEATAIVRRAAADLAGRRHPYHG